jgi:NAD(P)-dependent dehydrogenase (short-subunit alcohol dehydrogenase family)
MVRATAAHFGRLDVLVNNAAITFVGDLEIPMKRHDLVMEVNHARALHRHAGGGAAHEAGGEARS